MTAPRSIVLAGAQRSASTSLAEHLGGHPCIAMARHEVVALEDPYYPGRLPDLLRHLRHAGRAGRVAGLKRPELLHRPEGAERVARHLPGTMVVISLREPIARSISAYRHYVRHGLLSDLPIEDGLGELLRRRQRNSAWTPGDQVLGHSHYSEGVRRFLDASGLETVVLFHEEWIGDNGPVVEEIIRRLGLEPVDLGAFPRINAGAPLDRLGLERMANRLCYDLRPEIEAFAVTSNVIRLGAGRALRAVSSVLPRSRNPVDELSTDFRRRLARLFADDVLHLERLLGRQVPLSWQASLAG